MNILSLSERKRIINEIKSDENTQRKIVSYKKWNMQRGNFYQYVKEHLESKLDPETVEEMNVFSNVNLQRRVSTQEASIYRETPSRKFFIDKEEIDEFKSIYDSVKANEVLRRANVSYKYQEQCFLQVVPDFDDGCIESRLLLPHHVDVVPNPKDPRKAYCYIISNFDNTDRDRVRRDSGTRSDRTGFSQGDIYRDSVNQTIADWDDPQLKDERFYFWTDLYNFTTNGRGEILDKDTEQVLAIQDWDQVEPDSNINSPLAEFRCLPFVDVCSKSDKDFEFYVQPSSELYYSCILYNVIMSFEHKTVELQGHAQAYYKGDAEHMPENMRVGADKVIFIPVNPNNEVSAEFGFANPGSDLAGIREFRESFLASFLSSRGLDVSILSGKGEVQSATSGVEKLLQMIEKFEASRDDFSLFKNIEHKMFYIICCWIKSLYGVRSEGGELLLSEQYQINLPELSSMSMDVNFATPGMIKTDKERLDTLLAEQDMGISSKVHAAMEYYGMTEEQAVERLQKVNQYNKELGEV